MALYFQSIRSSSSGNCLMLFSERSAIVIDCGVKTQWECREALAERVGGPRFHGVLISHAHSDHIGYPALRSLAKLGIPLYTHAHVLDEIAYHHRTHLWNQQPTLREYSCEAFTVGEFHVTPMLVDHAPDCPNYGFVLRHTDVDGVRRKVVVCTDFFRYEDAHVDHFANADFIFVEANHDPELLRRFPNYASRFHMSNGKTGKLLRDARRRSDYAPSAVMLGHLSDERNTEELALEAIRAAFAADGGIDFELLAAPKFSRSGVIEVRLAEAGLFGRGL